jgi:GMP synthase-like glutamine amidotransferase
MHIAILVTNTDDSAFAAQHPHDGDKFRALLAPLRPDWRFTDYPVKDGTFPATPDGIDGVIITGSPASVHDGAPWIARLMDLIRNMAAMDMPMFGACFGHQAIAQALGGRVDRNPQGWVFGAVATAMERLGPIRLYAAHSEQVTALPDGARVTGSTPGCTIASFAIGTRVMTTQYHPEMSPDFIAALIEELAEKLPSDVARRARASLAEPADTDRIAEAIVGFFEAAAQDRAASRSIAVT